MFDPLAPTNSIFADDSIPPWPTTPHSPDSPLPNLRPATSPGPSLPDKAPTSPFGKEPQIYGQPEPGLISPKDNVSSNGTKYEKQEPYLRVKITSIDRNRRDLLVKFDAQTNLTNFTGTTYRNVSRSYVEFQQFYDAIVHSNPQTIVPALPLAQTSAPTDEEDDRLVRIMLQRWLGRVCADPILLTDEDLRAFIESDFGYQPTPRPRRKTSSGFGLMRRSVPDEDEELQRARFELTKLEGQFFDAAKAIDKLSAARKALAVHHAEMGNKLVGIAAVEAHPPLANAFRKIGRTWHSLADVDHAQSIGECVIIGDSFGYQGMNARSAKETLLQRTAVLEEYQAAVKSTISKRRHIERLKASSNIRADRVDEAIEEMQEADKYELVLAKRADGISKNLHEALKMYNRLANEDITAALVEHARSSIMYERQMLRELEALRPDVTNANKKTLPSNGIPKPLSIQTLEDPYPARPLSPPESRAQPSTAIAASHPQLPPKSAPATHASARPGFLYPQRPNSPPSPGTGLPSAPPQRQAAAFGFRSVDEPPLGGRFVDGTQSMFVKPPSSPSSQFGRASSDVFGPSMSAQPSSPLHPSSRIHNPSQVRGPTDPLLGAPIGAFAAHQPQPAAGAAPPLQKQVTESDLDPLAQRRPNAFMSSSMRVHPTTNRPRLDAREAASKLANLF